MTGPAVAVAVAVTEAPSLAYRPAEHRLYPVAAGIAAGLG